MFEARIGEGPSLTVNEEACGGDPTARGTIGHTYERVAATEHDSYPAVEGVLTAKPPHGMAAAHRVLAGAVVTQPLSQVAHHVVAELHIALSGQPPTHVVDSIEQVAVGRPGGGKTQLGILGTGSPFLVFDNTGTTFSHLTVYQGGTPCKVGIDGFGMVETSIAEGQIVAAVGSLDESGTLGPVIQPSLLKGTTEGLGQRAAMQSAPREEIHPISRF